MTDEKKKFDPNWKPFRTKCANPGCNNYIYLVNPNSSGYCSRACEANHKYSEKFIDERRFKPTEKK
jgi:hypothetical protein